MFLRKSVLLPAAISLSLCAPVSAQGTDASTVVATVNGVEITLGHLIVTRSTLPERLHALPDDVLYNGILDQMIQQTLLGQEIAVATPKRVQIALDNERRSLLAAEEIDRVLGIALSDRAIQALYDERYSNAGENEFEYDASHILVATEEEALQLVDQLNQGEDFAALAKAKSTGPSGPRGGALGWFGKGQMVPSFEEAVVGLEVDQISAPVQTQFGWHVIKLNGSRNVSAPTLESVRAELEQELSKTTIDNYIKDLEQEATVVRTPVEDINPALLKDISLLEK